MHSYTRLLRSQKHYREDSDCAVRALAVAARITYRAARACLAAVGRQPRDGATLAQLEKALARLGLDMWDVRAEYAGRTVRALEAELPRGYRFILDMGGEGRHSHVAGWSGARVVDHSAGSLQRVTSIFLIIETPNHVRRNRK